MGLGWSPRPLPGGAARGETVCASPGLGRSQGFGQRVSSVVKGPGTVAASLTYCDDVSSCRLSYHIAGLAETEGEGPLRLGTCQRSPRHTVDEGLGRGQVGGAGHQIKPFPLVAYWERF